MIHSRQKGDPDQANAAKFDRAFDRHHAELVRLATTVIGDPPTAEDIVQDTFVKLTHAPVLTNDVQEIAVWLRRVCVNASLNQLRADRRRRDRDDRFTMLTTAPEQDRPESQIIRQEEREHVRTALNAIPETLRACLVLRHSGYSYAEIAATLEIAIGSVGVYLARGERAFRMQFEENLS